jgi:hypothetical protein
LAYWAGDIRLLKTDCKSDKKSYLKRVILEVPGTFLKLQKLRSALEYCRNTSSNWSVGMENIFWIIRAQIKAVRGYVRVRPVDA